MTISIGIITEQLQNYGGSEIYILECIKRWQHDLDIVVYTTKFNRKLFKEYGIDSARVSVKILPGVNNRKHRFDLLDSLVIRARIWERHIAQHDLYFQYLFPAQMVRKSPSIWFAAEPLRMLYDLHHHETVDGSRISFHIYPRMRYDNAIKSDLNVVLQIVEELDRNSKIETLVTNSHMMGGYLETIYGRKADLVAYPGINLPSSYDGPRDNKTALFVGRLWQHKRVDLIIEAFSHVPDGKLLIVGDGPERKKLNRMVKHYGLKNRIHFYRTVNNQKLDQIYRSVTCGIYTPVREPFGIMPLEAASYGLPVIVTPDGGYTEVLDGDCAHIVSPDPEAIAEALNITFQDYARCRQMGEVARARAEGFTWDRTANELLKLFRRTLTQRRKVISNTGYRPLLGAHYYPWYSAGTRRRHWNENTDYSTVKDFPLQGIYSSNDVSVVEGHLEVARQAGLDYFVINLQITTTGLDENELDAAEVMFDAVSRSDQNFSLCFMLSCDKADSQSISAAIEHLETRFISHPNYLRLQHKPVIWFFISESFIGHFFYHYTQLRQSMQRYVRIAASSFCYTKNLTRHYQEFFNAWTLYSPLQISLGRKREMFWKSSYQDFIEQTSDQGFGAFTLCPGYDDTGLTLPQRNNSEIRDVARNDIGAYQQMQDVCMQLDPFPSLVIVTSFNEFHESTHIEPTVDFGNSYIEATKVFSDRLKKRGMIDPRETDRERVSNQSA